MTTTTKPPAYPYRSSARAMAIVPVEGRADTIVRAVRITTARTPQDEEDRIWAQQADLDRFLGTDAEIRVTWLMPGNYVLYYRTYEDAPFKPENRSIPLNWTDGERAYGHALLARCKGGEPGNFIDIHENIDEQNWRRCALKRLVQ